MHLEQTSPRLGPESNFNKNEPQWLVFTLPPTPPPNSRSWVRFESLRFLRNGVQTKVSTVRRRSLANMSYGDKWSAIVLGLFIL